MGDEVECVFSVDVFCVEIVSNKTEGDKFGAVFGETWCVIGGDVSNFAVRNTVDCGKL